MRAGADRSGQTARVPDDDDLLQPPVRTTWFAGRLLDAVDLNRESTYVRSSLRRLRGLALGWGVVAGLDVAVDAGGTGLVVTSGLALDPWGREIVVGAAGVPVPPPAGLRAGDAVEVVVRVDERPDHPVPVLGQGDTHDGEDDDGSHDDDVILEPSVVEEVAVVEVRPVPPSAPPAPSHPLVQALVEGRLDRAAVARWVTEERPAALPADPSVPLARAVVGDGGGAWFDAASVDPTVRPVVLGTTDLAALVLALADGPGRR